MPPVAGTIGDCGVAPKIAGIDAGPAGAVTGRVSGDLTAIPIRRITSITAGFCIADNPVPLADAEPGAAAPEGNDLFPEILIGEAIVEDTDAEGAGERVAGTNGVYPCSGVIGIPDTSDAEGTGKGVAGTNGVYPCSGVIGISGTADAEGIGGGVAGTDGLYPRIGKNHPRFSVMVSNTTLDIV